MTFLSSPERARWALLHLVVLLLFLCLLPGARAVTLNGAVDNTSLTFTTTGQWTPEDWTGSKDGVDSLTGKGINGQVAELRATVQGPGWLVFWTNAASGSGPSLLVDGVVKFTLTSASAWEQRGLQLGPGSHEVVWRTPANVTLRLDSIWWGTDIARSLTEVLPGFTWTTGGTTPWTGALYRSQALLGSAQLNLPLSATAQDGWLQTTITGPCRLAWDAWGPALSVNGISVFEGYTGHCKGVLTAGSHSVRWRMTRPGNPFGEPVSGWLESVRVTPGTALSLSEALESPSGLAWTTGGDAPWEGALINDAVPLKGAFSGFVTAGRPTWIETTVMGPGTISVRGSTDSQALRLVLTANGVSLGQYPLGHPVIIGAGTYALRWTYTPDSPYGAFGEIPRMRLGPVSWTPQQGASITELLQVQGPGLTLSSDSSSMDVFGQTTSSPGTTGVFVRAGHSLKASVTGPAQLIWRETNYLTGFAHAFVCTLDGLPVNIVHRTNGSEIPLEVPPGQHEVKWTATLHFSDSHIWLNSLTYTSAAAVPLVQALNSTGVTWQTSPEVSAFDGMACVFLPQEATAARFYGLGTTLTGPGEMTLRWRKRAGNNARLLIDGTAWAGGNMDNPNQWSTIKFWVTPGTHMVSFEPPPPVTAGTAAAPGMWLVDEASWFQQQQVTLAEALDATNLTFTTGGDGVWQGVSGGGSDFARSVNLGANKTAWIETTLTGPGMFSFRLGTAVSGDAPQFTIDGLSRTASYTGVTSFEMPSGAHTLRWSWTQPGVSGVPLAGYGATLDAVTWVAYNAQPLSAWTEAAGRNFTSGSGTWLKVDGPDSNGGGSLHPVDVPADQAAWLQTTVSGPAAVTFSLWGTGLAEYDSATISVDGTARELKAMAPANGEGWTDHALYVPQGSHTVRWTLQANRTLVWLDRLKVTGVGSALGAPVEFTGGVTQTGPARFWFPFISTDFVDGDGLMVESGFRFLWDEPTNLKFVVNGPGSITLHLRSTTAPGVSVPGTGLQWPMSWHDEADGWKTVSAAVPPGPHDVRVIAANDMPLLVDRATWTAAPAPPPLSSVFPIAGVTWTTSAGNGFYAYTDLNVVPRPSLMCASDGNLPAGWLDAAGLTGPGTLSFTVQAYNSEAPFQVVVDGKTLPPLDQSTSWSPYTSTMAPQMPASRRYSVALGSGAHTVRWLMPVPEEFTPPSLLMLQEITFTSGGGLLTTFPNGPAAYIYAASPAPQVLSESGTPFIRIASAVPLPNPGDEPGRALCNTAVSTPGVLHFRWRKAPGAWPADAWASVVLLKDDAGAGIGPLNSVFPLTAAGSSVWQEVKLFFPAGQTRIRWHVPHTVAGLDLSGITFTPMAATPLDVALGIPGKTIVTDSDPNHIWSGLSGSGYPSFAAAPLTTLGDSETPWIETTFTGPMQVTWTQYGTWDNFTMHAAMDGMDGLASPLTLFPDYPESASSWREMQYGLVIPSGSHVMRWRIIHRTFGERAGVGNVRTTPLPAAYASWQPPVPGNPGMHFTPVPSADYEDDGMTNLAEYTWRTDPFTPNQPLRPLVTVAGGRITLTLPAPRPITDGVRVYVESSTGNLAQWQRVTVETLASPPAGQVQYRYTVPPATPRVFLRVGVEFVP